jgi:hypothetical protein
MVMLEPKPKHDAVPALTAPDPAPNLTFSLWRLSKMPQTITFSYISHSKVNQFKSVEIKEKNCSNLYIAGLKKLASYMVVKESELGQSLIGIIIFARSRSNFNMIRLRNTFI